VLATADRTACSEQSEGIFFAPRDDTGIIAFVLAIILAKGVKGAHYACGAGTSGDVHVHNSVIR